MPSRSSSATTSAVKKPSPTPAAASWGRLSAPRCSSSSVWRRVVPRRRCAIYLSEYAKHGKFLEMVRLAILNLAGVPSVVFGLFGLGAFVLTAPVFVDVPADRSVFAIPLGFTNAQLRRLGHLRAQSGGFTLAFVILPVIITASEQCLQAVPQGFRETSMALGATRWQTIRYSVLPFATPGILTSSILGIARAAGETAPIMFTAALAFKDKLPWQKDLPPLPADASIFAHWEQSVSALPRHLHRVRAGAAVSHLHARRQDPAERILRARAIRLRLRFPRPRRFFGRQLGAAAQTSARQVPLVNASPMRRFHRQNHAAACRPGA
jgi:ABC-type phosphate transport system permease subunit